MPRKSPTPKVDSKEEECHSVFHYHACAHAFGGQFSRPFHDLIEVQAPAVLPIVGGYGNSRVENFRYREFIHFTKAYTHVSGGFQESDKSNNTLATATLEGLNILDVLTADRVVARLYTKHPHCKDEGFVSMAGSKFENLKIAGHPIDVELDFDLFKNIRNFEEAQIAYKNNADFRKIAEDPFQTGRKLLLQKPNGAYLCSLVKETNIQHPGVERTGHCFYVPGFGRVFLAEVVIAHGERTLTMFRLELGSSIAGTGSGGYATSNGKNYPPTG
jgi:hypothetical protein